MLREVSELGREKPREQLHSLNILKKVHIRSNEGTKSIDL